jgi:2-amino-4-hydroxy-6-hydroxymethyldihydropteridine diphosphokinase
MNTVILGLGSNIAPEKNMPEALRRLSKQVKIEAVSSLWKTAAVGSEGPIFLNAAAKISTEYGFNYLKEEILCAVEATLGRVRVEDKNAPRTIDLDILVFNQQIVELSIFRFDHLILPVAELIPDLCEPDTGKSLGELAVEHCCKLAAVRVGKLVY